MVTKKAKMIIPMEIVSAYNKKNKVSAFFLILDLKRIPQSLSFNGCKNFQRHIYNWLVSLNQ